MPLYEYECQDCSNVQAILRSIAERDSLLRCESCDSKRMMRRIDVPFAYPRSNASEETVSTVAETDDFDGITIDDLHAEESFGDAAMRVEGQKVCGRKWRFKNNQGNAIDAINADIDADDVSIE